MTERVKPVSPLPHLIAKMSKLVDISQFLLTNCQCNGYSLARLWRDNGLRLRGVEADIDNLSVEQYYGTAS